MRDIVRIETKRLKLRPLALTDAARVALYTRDFEVARMTAAIPHPQLAIGAEGWILINLARRQEYVFAVDLSGEGMIGCIGAHPGKRGAGTEIGYWFGRPFWGRGYASEAVSAFVTEAAKYWPLAAGHFVDNPASGRVLEKTGFVYTGETVEMFSLARGERVSCRRMRYAGDAAARTAEDQRELA